MAALKIDTFRLWKKEKEKKKEEKRKKKVCVWENKDKDGNCEFWSDSAESTQLQSAASNNFHLNPSKHKNFLRRHLKIIVKAGYQAKRGEETEGGQEQSQEISILVTRQMTRILYSVKSGLTHAVQRKFSLCIQPV